MMYCLGCMYGDFSVTIMAELQQVLVAGGPVFLTFCVSMLC